jgi:hypothetical protein
MTPQVKHVQYQKELNLIHDMKGVNRLSHYTTKCNEHFLQSFRCLTMNHF